MPYDRVRCEVLTPIVKFDDWTYQKIQNYLGYRRMMMIKNDKLFCVAGGFTTNQRTICDWLNLNVDWLHHYLIILKPTVFSVSHHVDCWNHFALSWFVFVCWLNCNFSGQISLLLLKAWTTQFWNDKTHHFRSLRTTCYRFILLKITGCRTTHTIAAHAAAGHATAALVHQEPVVGKMMDYLNNI